MQLIVRVDERSSSFPPSSRRTIRRTPRPVSYTTDSTLTQMDFFDTALGDDDVQDDASNITREETKQDHGAGKSRSAIEDMDSRRPAQVDGNYDSPRKKRRKGRTSVDLDIEDTSYTDGSKNGRPPRKQQCMTAAERPPSRAAAQKAREKILSDPDQNLEYFRAALEEDERAKGPKRTRRSEKDQRNDPKSHDDKENEQGEPVAGRLSDLLETPRKRKEVIPSSQSPESLPPSTRKRSTTLGLTKTPKKSPSRQPLRDVSVNTPRHHARNHGRESISPTLSPTPKRKICVLRLPQKESKQIKPRIEDSQADVYSIQATSSPRAERESQNPSGLQMRPGAKDADDLEIPGTCQSQLDLDANMSSSPPMEHGFEFLADMPEIDLEEPRAIEAILEDFPKPANMPLESPVLVRDFAAEDVATSAPKVLNQAQTPAGQNNATNSKIAVATTTDDDDDSGFGSPIANDTQFNADLASRLLQSPLKHSPSQQLRSDLAASASFPVIGPALHQESLEELLEHELPPPRLIYLRTTTTGPLNDTNGTPTSSPSLPQPGDNQSPMRTTQKSIHPASMPHQSQISTQEPTQAYLPPRSLPVPSLHLGTLRDPERITIKDSSSMSVSMSQLPQYDDEGPQSDADAEHAEDVDLDVDLDPPSTSVTARTRDTRPRPAVTEEGDVNNESTASRALSSSPDPAHPNVSPSGHPTRARMKHLRQQGPMLQGRESDGGNCAVESESQMPAWYFEDPCEGMEEL